LVQNVHLIMFDVHFIANNANKIKTNLVIDYNNKNQKNLNNLLSELTSEVLFSLPKKLIKTKLSI